MSMIEEQVKELRAYANASLYARENKARELLSEAADTIEILSEKLSAANMERSAGYYGGGWIPCSERLPEENQNVIACFAHGTVTELAFYDGKFHGIYSYDTKVILAWMPLPERYCKP